MTHAANYILNFFAIVLILSNILPLLKIPFGAIRGLEFPRMQMFWICAGLSIVSFLILHWHWTNLAFFLLSITQAFYIAKFTPLWRKQSIDADSKLKKEKDKHIQILTANVKLSNRSYQHLINLTHAQNPDILVAIETDKGDL